MTRKGHKSHCHHKHNKLGTHCACQKHSSHSQGTLTPDSTDECVVFEYDNASNKWETANYSPDQTKGKASLDEIERFLNEINEPLSEWSKKYGKINRGEGIYFCLALSLIILLPIFFIYICWFSGQQDKAKEKLEDVKYKVSIIVQERAPYFAGKSLAWNVPEKFPQWIELWLDEEDGGKPEAGDIVAPQQQMVGYEKSGYPSSPKVVPV